MRIFVVEAIARVARAHNFVSKVFNVWSPQSFSTDHRTALLKKRRFRRENPAFQREEVRVRAYIPEEQPETGKLVTELLATLKRLREEKDNRAKKKARGIGKRKGF